MKNTLSLLGWLLCAALCLASCQEEENVSDIPGVSHSTWTTSVQLGADETTASYTFDAAGAWVASSQQSWCKVTSSGQAGASTLVLTLEPNTSAQERSTLISIAFNDGYKGDTFVVTQAGNEQGEEPQEASEENELFYDYLSKYYLWNEEYCASLQESDGVMPYTSDADNFFVNTLTRLGKTGVNNLDYKYFEELGEYNLYSYVTRTPWSARTATRAAGGEIDHSGYDLPRTTAPSYGIASPIIIQFVDQGNNPTGTYGIGLQAVYPGSPADEAGLRRGDLIATLNGSEIRDYMSAYNALMNPAAGVSVSVGLNERGGGTYVLRATPLDLTPVLMDDVFEVGGARIGYLHYLSFDAAYDNDLLAAVKRLGDAGIDELILDLRYNGGGHEMTANMLSTLIAGDRAKDKVFCYYRYNAGRMADVEGTATESGQEYDEAEGKFAERFYYDNYGGANLGQYGLGLPRVFVITSFSTASASEAVINGLLGIGVDVVTVGETSNGKNTGMEVMGNNQSIGGYYYEMAGITFQLYNANGDTTDPDGIRPDLPAQEMVPDESGKIYRPFGKDEPLIAAAIEAITGVNTFAAGTRSATAAPALRVVRPAAVQQSSPRRPQGTLVLKQLTIDNGQLGMKD